MTHKWVLGVFNCSSFQLFHFFVIAAWVKLGVIIHYWRLTLPDHAFVVCCSCPWHFNRHDHCWVLKFAFNFPYLNSWCCPYYKQDVTSDSAADCYQTQPKRSKKCSCRYDIYKVVSETQICSVWCTDGIYHYSLIWRNRANDFFVLQTAVYRLCQVVDARAPQDLAVNINHCVNSYVKPSAEVQLWLCREQFPTANILIKKVYSGRTNFLNSLAGGNNRLLETFIQIKRAVSVLRQRISCLPTGAEWIWSFLAICGSGSRFTALTSVWIPRVNTHRVLFIREAIIAALCCL